MVSQQPLNLAKCLSCLSHHLASLCISLLFLEQKTIIQLGLLVGQKTRHWTFCDENCHFPLLLSDKLRKLSVFYIYYENNLLHP